MFSLEQKRLADAQVAFLVATIKHHQSKRGPELAEMLGMPYDEYRDLVWSNQPGDGKIERLADMTARVKN